MNEDELERAVVDLAHTFGWRAVGHRPMRTRHGWRTGWKYDGEGFPDLTLTHQVAGSVIFAELKIPPNDRTNRQAWWGDHLEAVQTRASDIADTTSPASLNDPPIRYRVWTPDDADDIATVLSFNRVTRWTL